ncbi:MAG TPA: GAF domain-containing protein [Chloroflexi bacterium]|nr:GAF domain-containing protein [Chloroflexota bacterium]
MKAKHTSGHNARLNVGVLIQDTTGAGGYESAMLDGITNAAEKRDVNLICYPGGMLHAMNADAGDRLRNTVYDLIDTEQLNGLIISASLSNYLTPEEFEDFYQRFLPLPMVSIARTIPGIPSVVVDNYGGMRKALAHLTQEHAYRRIAFIQGPEGNEDAERRYEAYTDILTEYGIPINPHLVVAGNYQSESGREAIRVLLDERKAGFQALVAADDNMALGAMQALQERGIRVPYDIAVVGFDDIEESQAINPPLTTVQQPVKELGKRAIHTLLSLISGAEVSEQIIVPTRLIVRQSCNCLSSAMTQAAIQTSAIQSIKGQESLGQALDRQRENILFEMLQAMEGNASTDVTSQAEQLLDAFAREIIGGEPGGFLAQLDNVLREGMAKDDDVSLWQNGLSELRRHTRPYLNADENGNLVQAEDLWQQARVMIGETAHRALAQKRLEEKRRDEVLNQVTQNLIATFDMEYLMENIIRDLPKLGIPGFYLSLYEGAKRSTEKSKFILGYDGQGAIEAEDDITFPSRRLIPPHVVSERGLLQNRYTLIVEPLDFEEALGFAAFEVGPRDWRIYDMLRRYLSSALRANLLVQEVRERTRSLQEANYALQRRAIQLEASAEVAQAITSIFDVDTLLRKAVNLIRDRFGFYHAGIFFLDKAGEWAVLREATGKAGAQMKSQSHRLAVAETSMVGWTAKHRQPRIALYADEDAVRFANPLLPYTRSEMTLPMMIGEQLLGVLNVQSTEEAAFDDDDIRALQSMANQIAVAIENAQRISEEALLLEAASPIYRVSRDLAQVTTISEVADAIINSVKETGADGCTIVEFEFSPEGIPEALLYRGVWRRDRETQFRPGMRLPITESPFPLEMVSSLWTVANVEKDEQLPESARQVFVETGVRALANIPLRARDQVIGQVVVLRSTPGPFSDSAIRLYEALSDQAAVALERAQLWEEAQKRARYEQTTRQTIDRIRRALDIEQALQTTVQELSQAMNVPHVSIDLNLQTGD